MEDNNKERIHEQGVALFVAADIKENIYYEDCVPERFLRNQPLSNNVLSLRNILFILTVIEIGAAIWGFSYYFIRRVTFSLY